MEVTVEMTVRQAQVTDLDRVVELGRRFLHEGPYAEELADNPERAGAFTHNLFNTPGARILVAECEGKVVGVFALLAYPHLFSGELTAVELIWYVEPEHRAGGIALKLLAEAEHTAREMGCLRMQLTAPTEEVGKLYKYCGGYKKIEVCYQRKF
jgi:GNAT superfamily N-acetyltransferase